MARWSVGRGPACPPCFDQFQIRAGARACPYSDGDISDKYFGKRYT